MPAPARPAGAATPGSRPPPRPALSLPAGLGATAALGGVAVQLGRLGACRGWALLSLSTWSVAKVSGFARVALYPSPQGAALAGCLSCVSVFLGWVGV